MSTSYEFDNAAEQWLRNHRFSSDPQALTKIAQRVRENLDKLGGYVSASSYERAYLELTASGAIKPFRGTVTEHVAAETPADPAGRDRLHHEPAHIRVRDESPLQQRSDVPQAI